MILGIVVMLTALAISAVAAWFSIIGLTEIFSLASAFWPVVIMGVVLEIGKLVLASTLYQKWKDIGLSFKGYFIISLFVLMLITSMGIFGYLSRAHLEAIKPVGNITEEIALIEDQITIQKEIIATSREQIGEFQKTLTEKTFEGFKKHRTNTKRALKEIKKQDFAKSFVKDIEEASDKIKELQERRLPLKQGLQDIESEVGPVRYVAELIYGERTFSVLDKAVRLVILLIVFVFDPLAVALVIMGNKILMEPKAVVVTTRKLNKRATPKPKMPRKTKATKPLEEFLVPKGKPTGVAMTQDGTKWTNREVLIDEK